MKQSFLDWLVGDETWWWAQTRSFLFVTVPFMMLIASFLAVDSCAGGEV